MRVVYAVGSRVGYPFEVYALFDEEADARRHADASAYAFDVFPLPVYASYDDLPFAARAVNAGNVARLSVAHIFGLGEDEIEFARLAASEAQAEGHGNQNGRVYSARGFNEREPEVYALYATDDEGQRHVTDAAYHVAVVPIEVYPSYESCPAEQRYAIDHGPLSQHIHPKPGLV
jgi:hypothetical protein